jgi:erythromycin esterase-like protein
VGETLRAAAHPLTGSAGDYDPLTKLIGDARIVLLGEASHGTHEFYRERARITQRLIEEHGFTVVAAETERLSHYFEARLPETGELPETYPFGE